MAMLKSRRLALPAQVSQRPPTMRTTTRRVSLRASQSSLRVAPRPVSARHDRLATKAFFKSPLDPLFDKIEQPIVRTALKEPLAFWGGVFAGTLGLNLSEEPLRAWVDRTAAVVNGTEPSVPKPSNKDDDN